jgi:hypothetical protein
MLRLVCIFVKEISFNTDYRENSDNSVASSIGTYGATMDRDAGVQLLFAVIT